MKMDNSPENNAKTGHDMTTKESLSRVIYAFLTRIFLSQRIDEVESQFTVAQRKVLLGIEIYGPINMTDIARQEGITLPAATVLIDKLVTLGYVERISDKNDRRLVLITLTPEGRAITENLKQRYLNRLNEILNKDVNDQDRHDLLKSLNKLADIFQRTPPFSRHSSSVTKSLHAGGRKATRFKGDSKKTHENKPQKPWDKTSFMFIGMAAIAMLFTGCGNKGENIDNVQKRKVDYQTILVNETIAEEKLVPEKISVVGSLTSHAEAEIASRVGGSALERLVNIGDYVTTGQVLARLDPEVVEINLAQAKAQMKKLEDRLGVKSVDVDFNPDTLPEVKSTIAEMELAKTNHERNLALHATNTISQADVDKSHTDYEKARQSYMLARRIAVALFNDYITTSFTVKDLRRALNDMTITAPFAGFIASHNIEPGEYIKEGMGVVKLIDTDPIHVQLTVPEKYVEFIHKGQEVNFSMSDKDDYTNHGVITFISPSIDENSRSLMVEALTPNPDNKLVAGSFIKAHIIKDAFAKAILLPEKAVKTVNDTTSVFQNIDGIAREIIVRVGDTSNGMTEIRDGLTSGARIVSNATNVYEGVHLRVTAKQVASDDELSTKTQEKK